MMMGVLGIVLANVASGLGANALRKSWRCGSADLEVLLFLLLRLLIISAVVLGFGLLGILRGAVVAGCSGVAIAVLLRFGHHRDLPRVQWREAGPLLGAALALVAIRLFVQVWVFTPHLADALSYHLPKVAEWVHAGAFTRELGAHTHVTYPAGFELIETWWVVFPHHDVLIEMAGVEFVVLAFFAVRALATACGLDAKGATFAALLFILTPGFHLSATSSMNDAPAAAITLAMFALMAGRAPLPALLAAAGMGLGIKPTVGFALPGVVCLYALLRREPHAPGEVRSGPAWGCAVVGLFVGSYWYVRNFAWYGNPFYPMGESNFHDPTVVQFGPRWSSLTRNLGDLIDVRIYDAIGILGPNVDHMAGWGVCAFACGILCLAQACRTSLPVRRLAISLGVSLLGTLLLVQHDPWCLKYVFYVPSVMTIAVALRMQEVPSLRWLGGIALALSFAASTFSYDLQGPHALALLRMPWKDRSAVAYSFREMGAGSREDAVAYFGGPTGPSYLLYRPDFSRRVVFLRTESSADLHGEMSRHNLRDLFAPAPTDRQRIILEAAARDGLLKHREAGWWHRLP